MDSTPPSRYTYLEFNAPLSNAHASALVETLRPLAATEIVDLGCGWAELLLRVLAAEATARGTGIDDDEPNLVRARANAQARGLADRVRLECGNATQWATGQEAPVDIAIMIGASHAWGGIRETLDAVRPRLKPGGRFLVGECFWERPPTPEALAGLGAQPDEFSTLDGLIDLCLDRGFGLLSLSTSTLQEWDDFESRFGAAHQRWLLANPGAPGADRVRAELDAHRDGWLKGYRTILGFAYLTLGV